MPVSAAQRRAYDASIRAAMRSIGRLNKAAQEATVREMAALLTQVRRIITENIGTESVGILRDSEAQLRAAMADFARRYQISATELADLGWDAGVGLAVDPINAIGFSIGRGLSRELFDVATATLPELIQNTTADIQRRVRSELTGVATGTQTVEDALRNIGRTIRDPGHFRTMRARAEAILITEVGRVQAIATQAKLEEIASDDIPELLKRWRNAHLPGARAEHLEAESRYAIDGSTGPIPVDELYAVGGEEGLYPRSGSFSARNVVHCHCVSIPVLPEDLEVQEPGAAAMPAPPDPEPEPTPPPAAPNIDEIDDGRVGWAERAMRGAHPANAERVRRLAEPITKPPNWDDMPKTRRIRLLEDRMEADWPQGIAEVEGKIINTVDTVFNLQGLDPDIALSQMNAMRGLGAAFPRVAERLDYVGTYRGEKGKPWKALLGRRSRAFGPNTMAHATRDGRQIGIAAGKFSDVDELVDLEGHNHATGWWHGARSAADAGVGSIVHEFGHQIDNWIRTEASGSITPTLHPFGDGQISRIGDLLLQNGRFVASTYGSHSTAERFAEAFANYWLSPDRRALEMHDVRRSHEQGVRRLGWWIEFVRDVAEGVRPSWGIPGTRSAQRTLLVDDVITRSDPGGLEATARSSTIYQSILDELDELGLLMDDETGDAAIRNNFRSLLDD